MSRFIDFLAGCVVGGALLATGMVLSKWGKGQEQLHVSMLKGDSSALVWAVHPATGEARVVSYAVVPVETQRQLAREQARQVGKMLGSGNIMELATADFFQPMAEGAAAAKLAQRPPAR